MFRSKSRSRLLRLRVAIKAENSQMAREYLEKVVLQLKRWMFCENLDNVVSTEENAQHHLCPKGKDSWFADLAHPTLLEKCTHGLTQNLNKCLNGIIWDRCPKTTYLEQEPVALATYLAVLKFNDGDISYIKILPDLDIVPGFFASIESQGDRAD